ncbi:hypothetical protein ACVWWJ_003299 [Luteibacter sp. HA06]
MTKETTEVQVVEKPQGAFAGVPQQQEMPLALVRGQAVMQMPQDLYIPPDALEVILESFEGPLDLLLYLIRRARTWTSSTSLSPRSPGSTWTTST